jgi:hypothetical protein
VTDGGAGTSPARRLASRTDLQALAAWLATRIVVIVVSAFAGSGSFAARWTQWDVTHLIVIARFGYRGDPALPHDGGLPAFFPGFPLLLRLVHLVVPSWQAAALAISFVAGAIAMVALARLGAMGPRPAAGPLAVVALLLGPFAVFLFAGYTEPVFLAFAFPAWLMARRGRWPPACLLAAGAATVRITGLFLAIALIVEFLVQIRRGTARWRDLAWLAVPFLPLIAYSAYLRYLLGDWLVWQHAQEAGWGRSLVWPWRSFTTTWDAAFRAHDQFSGAFQAEMAAAAVGVAVAITLLVMRRWAEFTYVALQMAAFLCSAYYLSIGRATLLWWPLWLGVGWMGARGRWWTFGYVVLMAASAPIMLIQVISFVRGAWAG